MSKENVIVQTGIVTDALSNSMFKVELDTNSIEIICSISGKMRINNIRVMVGDHVKVAISPYDLSKGRIETRLKE